jgi:nucleoside 2-deoxyribosyltransferase
MQKAPVLLLVGEVYIDFTVSQGDAGAKLRLGGIAHAGRGLWACGLDYAVGAVCPKYLVDQAKQYLSAHGCVDFVWLGETLGAPNVIAIADATEVSDQGYEDLLRDEREAILFDRTDAVKAYAEALIFPGSFDLSALRKQFPARMQFSFDIAYDIAEFARLDAYVGNIRAIIISTSSKLFQELGSQDIQPLLESVSKLDASCLLVKENRGGSRLFDIADGHIEQIPAALGSTVNSVGVGDAYSAVFVALGEASPIEAAWRGARVATYYAQTTFPDDFRRDVQRDLKVPFETLKSLGGTILPWHARPHLSIYLAAPDFSYLHKPEIDRAIESLRYHNFRLRRPIQENGELAALPLEPGILRETYLKDVALLKECVAVFAVPLGRDPGTLIEVGIAQALGLPIITFDPRGEVANTMVLGGSDTYSRDLDICLNGLFDALARLRS